MLIKTEDKRKSKRVEQTPKKCLWCEELIEIGFRSPAQYKKLQTHKDCVTSWTHYRVPKRLAEEAQDRGIVRCEACNKIMERRYDEKLQSWEKRRFCNKSCAATRTGGGRAFAKSKAEIEALAEEKRLGLKRYVRGTPEFNQVAALYM